MGATLLAPVTQPARFVKATGSGVTVQLIPTAVMTTLKFNSLTHPDLGLFTLSATGELLCALSGWYDVSARAELATATGMNTGNQRVLQVALDGTDMTTGSTQHPTGSSNSISVAASTAPIRILAGQKLSAGFFQDTGADKTIRLFGSHLAATLLEVG